MVDKYSTDKAWEYVSLVEGHGLKNHIARLIQPTLTYQSVAGKPNLPPISYKQRIMDYLSENTNNPVIQKIRNLEQLTHNDILQLEKVLWEELGSKEDYENQIQNQFQGGNVAVFIRSLIGVNHSIALEKFSDFIDINTLNSDQLEYIKTIIDYVSINGDIDGNTITNKEPFTEFKWIDVYGDKLAYIGKYVSALHEVIVVA